MAEFGTESCFNTVNTEYNAVAMLDSTHVVVAYKDTGGAGYGCAKVGVIDGNTVTWGAENIFNSAVTSFISVSALDSTHFVVSYRDDGNSSYGTSIVGLVSGTTISSYGAENVFRVNTTYRCSVGTLDSTHFVVAYQDVNNSNYGTAIVGVTSGTTISSYGAENVFNGASTSHISLSVIDSTHFVVAYQDVGNSSYGTAIVGVTSGTTISSYGGASVYNSDGSTYYNPITTLDSTHFAISYSDGGNSDYGTAIIGVTSGTTISSYGVENVFNSAITRGIAMVSLNSTDYAVLYRDDGGDSYGCARIWGTTVEKSLGTESCFNTVNTEYNAVAMLDSTHVIVAYKDTGGSGYGCAKVGLIDGNTVTWGVEKVFNSALTDYISVSALDSTHFVVAYRDDGGADYGCARVGLVSGTTISSYGAENIFNSAGSVYISVAKLNTTHFVVTYQDTGGDGYGCARVGLISGTTISSYGAENVFNSATTIYNSVAALDSTHFVVVYEDVGNSNYATGIVGVTDGGTTINSYGSENVYNSTSKASYTSVATLDSTHFVITYRDWGNSYYGTAIVGLVSGTTISSYGSESVFLSTGAGYTSVSVLDSTHFVVGYRGTSEYGCARQGTVSGTTISGYDTEVIFNSAVTVYIAVTTLNSTDYIVVYKDDGGADYGCGRVWGTSPGWSAGIIMGVASPGKIMGIEIGSIASVIGI